MSEKKQLNEEEIKNISGGGLWENMPERWCNLCKKMTKQKRKSDGTIVCSDCDRPYWEGYQL